MPARAVDFDQPADNDGLAVNQFTVVENKHPRRPDIVLFVTGLPGNDCCVMRNTL